MGRRKGPSLTREEVVEAAIACVRAEGPEALGISRVARQLGIQPPSLYNHVGSLDDLATAVLVEGNRRLLETLDEAVAGVRDPVAMLRALAWGVRGWALQNANLYALMSRIAPPNSDPEFAPLLERLLAVFGHPLAELGVGDDQRVHAIRSLRATLHGFLVLQIAGQFQLAEDPEESFRWAIEALLWSLDHRRRPLAPE